MSSGRAVILTDNLYDYALAAAARRQLAERAGFADCWPVVETHGGSWGPEALRALYGVATVRLTDLAGGDSRDRAGSQAPPEVLLPAFLSSLAQGRPLLLDGAAGERRQEEPDWEACARQRLVVARRGSPMALPAAFYAAAVGKPFVHVDSLAGIEERLDRCNPASVVLVDEMHTFTKPFLERLLAWSQAGPVAPVCFGIMAGHSVEQLSAIVGRLLVHRDFHGHGRRLAEPAGLRPIPVRDMEPLEYYVIGAHGNEMHLRHQGEEVLCGAFADRRTLPEAFDCERSCRHAGRVRGSEVAAHTVFLLSCDAFTLGDGLAPLESNVMLNLLNGWTTSVLAPMKHVQGNQGVMMLVDALIHSGYSVGEIAVRLNSLSRFGDPADPAYLVWGDPDLVVDREGRRATPPATWAEVEEGLEVEFPPTAARAMEVMLPAAVLEKVIGGGGAPAVEPLSEELQRADVYFTYGALPARREVRLTVFSPQPLGREALSLRLTAAQGLDEAEGRAALDQMRRLAVPAEIGIDPEVTRAAQEEVLAILRAAAGYPRMVEQMLGDGIARNLDLVLSVKYQAIQRRVLGAILEAMATTRLWPSQGYARLYPRIRHAGPGSGGPCPFCGNSSSTWLYEDDLTHLPERNLRVCSRCGIIGDRPATPELEIRLAPCATLTRSRKRQTVVLRNVGPRPLEVAWFLQFNQWRQLGIEVRPVAEERVLAAGEEAEWTVEIHCAGPLPDDILHMHLFALTDTFGLHFASQKVVSLVRSSALEEAQANA